MRKREVSVGFTGTQTGLTQDQAGTLWIVLEVNSDVMQEIHHGDCIGADEAFVVMISHLSRDIKIVQHPPLLDDKRAFTPFHEQRDPKDYLKRNHDIVDESHLMIACPGQKNEILRSGTWATIRYAKKTKKDLMMIYPDGSHELIQHDCEKAEGKLPFDRA